MTDSLKKTVRAAVIVISLLVLIYIGTLIYGNIMSEKQQREYEAAESISEEQFEKMKGYVLENYEEWQEISESFIELYKNDERARSNNSFVNGDLADMGREDLAQVFEDISKLKLYSYHTNVQQTSEGMYYVQYTFVWDHIYDYEVRELLFYADDIKAQTNIGYQKEYITEIGDNFCGLPLTFHIIE